ncbi:hypothetical protein ACU063_19045 [Paenibacillus sp. M.A.Huq-81]
MFNLLLVNLECPRCKVFIDAEIEFKMGLLNLDRYRLRDTLEWDIDLRKLHQARPQDGSLTGEGYVCCPNPLCDKDFWVAIRVEQDIIVEIKIDKTRQGYIP